MAEHMTEAAKLYCANIGVLEEARRELTVFLDNVWEQCWERVQTVWQAEPYTQNRQMPTVWKENTPPGRWHVNLRESKIGIEVAVSDPRRSGDHQFYLVRLSTSNTQWKLLSRIDGARAALGNIAGEIGMQLSWENPNELAQEKVPVTPEDASDTAAPLGTMVYNWLVLLVKMDDWMGTQGNR
jgi:hypothetical protein